MLSVWKNTLGPRVKGDNDHVNDINISFDGNGLNEIDLVVGSVISIVTTLMSYR